jgi:hypothetical protein
MIDMLHVNAEPTRQETQLYVQRLVEKVALHVQAWQGAHGCVIMVAEDYVKVRAQVLDKLGAALDHLKVFQARWRIVFTCTCKWGKDNAREENLKCKEHTRSNIFNPASLGHIAKATSMITPLALWLMIILIGYRQRLRNLGSDDSMIYSKPCKFLL